jgi:hypothetical protein
MSPFLVTARLTIIGIILYIVILYIGILGCLAVGMF